SGGASAIYGADAVAGVVNFILRDRPDGLTVDARSGITGRGDAPRRRIALTGGSDVAQGRGHVWLHASHEDQGGLLSAARPRSATDYAGPSIFTPQGAFNLDGTIYGLAFDPAKGLIFSDYDGASGTKGIALTDGYDRNATRRILVPVRRTMLSGGLDFDVSGTVSLHLEGQYGETRSSSRSEPYPAAGGDPARDGVDAIEVPGGLALDNAFIPAPIAAEIAARNGDGNAANDVAFIAFRRRLGDVFDRSNANIRRLWRGVAELRGEMAGDWRWTATYVFGRTTDHSAADTILRSRLISALDAVAAGGAIVCRDPAARAAGCQPLNIFGADTASPGAIGWLRGGGAGGGGLQTTLDTRIDQHVGTVTFSGTALTLPAGAMHLVAGAEFRRETSVDDWDADTNAGRTLAARTDDVRGGFSAGSAFAEMTAPLLRRLVIQAAVRLDRFSTAGTMLNWQAGGGWSPIDGLHLHGAFSRASRAPNIAELYTSRRETFPGTATLDPCAGVTATRQGRYDAACRAISAIGALVAGGGTLSYTAAEVQAINGFNGGNPDLREETADTLTAGILLEPRAIPRFRLAVDYTRIRLSSAIAARPRPETVAECLSEPSSSVCGGLVQRLSNGKLSRVDAVLVNGGAIRHASIDTALDYGVPLGRAGAVDLHGIWTHLLDRQRQPFAGAAFVNELGQLQDALHARLGSGFRDRFVAEAVYRRGGVSLGWTMRYLSAVVDTLDPASAPADAINRVPAIAYHDLQLRISLPGQARREVYAGVLNLFDREPPLLPNGIAASGLLGVESAQDYDAVGRSVYLGLTIRF
ncbi:MAG: TonB-dependent receptor, partial [Sphingobium sp.]